MADSSNTEVDSQVGESTESETTSNSNGNFSGGFDSSALSNESLSVDSTPDFGIDFGSNNNSGSFDFSYNPFDDSGFDFGGSLSDSDSSSGSSETSKTYNESEPVMTVDEVYGKGNQSIVEDQGDYAASSNEKSNVETSTLGKQDEISVTPTSVTENKGLVNNNAIQSVEGLDFQQKDKESQDVLEAKKNRDEAEAKDKTAQMKDSLLANIGKPIGKQGDGDVSRFQLGNRDEDLAKAQAEVDRLANEKTKYENEQKKNADRLKSFYKEAEEKEQAIKREDADYQAKIANNKQLDAIGQKMQELSNKYQEISNKDPNLFNRPSIQSGLNNLKSEVTRFCEQLGIEPPTMERNAYQAKEALGDFQTWEKGLAQEYFDGLKDFSPSSISAYKAGVDEQHFRNTQQFADELDSLVGGAKLIEERQEKLKGLIADNEKKSAAANEVYNNLKNNSFVGEKAPAVTPENKAPVTTTPKAVENTVPDTKQTFDNAIKNAVEKGADEQTVKAMTDISTAIGQKQEEMKKAIEQNDIPTYIEAQKQYNGLLEDALKIGNVFTQTDYNKPFVEAVAKANDFKVTLADGTIKDYSQFATEMATKSPEIAKAMYEAKADELKRDGHNILAKIERAKASMVGTWIGSKLTRADNQVRNQFNQMAKTDMRATYAAYNNVLKDPKATPEQKAEASKSINQANALMTASAALKASTGFWSGIGDSMKDGVYGKTDPQTLNAYQKTLNTVDNLAKITLGLGVSPGANRAYQNMYYMAGAKVDESGLFSKDWDGDGFALCQEYGNNAAAGMIAGAGELATGTALFFNPSTVGMGLNLVID